MERYRSCHSIEGEIFFNHLNKIGYCCMLTPNGGQPVLYENYTGELIEWEEFFKRRDEHITLMKNNGSLQACSDCFWIRTDNWAERKKEFRYILLNIWVKCNLFCSYCTNHTDMNVLNNTKEYDIIPVLKDMTEKGILTKDTKIDIAGGESTLDKNFNNLLMLLINAGVKNININTNATIYSDSIKTGIESGCVSIITSVDCADARKFKQIKKKNFYKKVWKNLQKYSSVLCDKTKNNSVRTKYIILPGINDTKREIRRFILKSKKTKVSGVILNIDLHWLRKNSDDVKTMRHIIELTHYFTEISSILQIDWQVWAHIEDLIKRYNTLCPENPEDLSFIFEKREIKKNLLYELNYLLMSFEKFLL